MLVSGLMLVNRIGPDGSKLPKLKKKEREFIESQFQHLVCALALLTERRHILITVDGGEQPADAPMVAISTPEVEDAEEFRLWVQGLDEESEGWDAAGAFDSPVSRTLH